MKIYFYVFTFINTNVKWSSLGNTKTAQLFGYLQSVQQRIPAIKTTKGKKYAHFLHMYREYLVQMLLVYLQERKIEKRHKTKLLLNSNEWLSLTVRSSCSWGRRRKILCLLSAVVRSDLCSPVSIAEVWWIKTLLSQVGLTREQIFNTKCTGRIYITSHPNHFGWFVDGKFS